MVCDRCKQAVKSVLETNRIPVSNILLGEAEVEGELSAARQETLATALSEAGFELIDDKKSRLIEKIKNVAVALIHYSLEPTKLKTSEVIAKELHYDYAYLSNLFSSVEGVTIEQYIIRQKIEKIKEYIVYDELSLGEIADKMGYSSVAHLSAQFKKVTGMSPSQFKGVGNKARKGLDEVG